MSLDATIWAWKIRQKQKKGGCLKPLKKLVLLSLADRASEDHCAYPSMSRLVEDTEMDRKTVLKIIDELIEDGLIQDTGERKGRTKQVKVYRLMGVNGRETVPVLVHFDTENDDLNSPNNGTVPTTEQFQQFHERVPTIPSKSPNVGTRNLSKNLPLESKNKKDWLCLKKLRSELDQANPTVVPKSIIEASWFEREKKAFELFNAGNNLCDDLLIYHFADTLLKNRHKYDRGQNGKSIGESDLVFFSSPQQIYVFANKLAQLPEVIDKFSMPGESFEKLASRIAAKLSDPNELQNWKSHLQAVGFKPKSRGAA
ncbi:helix-turn-helix domain-containing protein [Acinetobacter sp.]|uniref:helix-turn-helix domain-containing protein n=1 Tax=Acinetobacter sp. TaxID=472 RepID=UPI00248754DF|nr:helix-turn-helix domain-containing protein [Acinetobacter sp.]MDI1225175.1 helix-turn-helix domain-containing protein [Acinetobacter sp.]